MSDFNPQLETVKTALKRMFTEGHFSICTIDKCLKITGSIPDKSVYQTMSALHCVSYSEMSEQLRHWLFEETIKMFQSNGFQFHKFEIIDNKIAKLYLS